MGREEKGRSIGVSIYKKRSRGAMDGWVGLGWG